MKRLLLGTMALIGLLSAGAAQAADMPVKAAPVAAPPPFSWSGFYIGAHVGAGWGTVESNLPFEDFALPISSHTVNGFLGGGQVGWNWQINSWLVFGFEGQFSGSDIKGDAPCLIVFNCHTKVNWLASAAGRVGYAYNQTLYYVKGGGAWADSDYRADFLSAGVATFTGSSTRSGWMVGAGIEQAFWTNWSAKLEYNFMDFGTDNIGFAFNNSCGRVKESLLVSTSGSCTNVDVTQKVHLIKFGVNYRFNWGAPAVAARY
jgi:outer membrane immunogenic protein